jgi:DNA-binding CsgD family transcriptional regulator
MPNEAVSDLSEREREILKLVATGVSNKEIAQTLFISQNTVKVHLRNIFSKIGAASRTEAAMYAVRIGLVENVGSQVLGNESAQDEDKSDFSTSQPGTAIKGNRTLRYLGITAGIVLIIVTISLVLNFGDIFTANSSTPPTPTQRVQWFQLPGLPTPRWGLAVVNYENQIYTIGGETQQGISSVVEKYDPQSDGWLELRGKPTPVTDASAAAIGGMIYVPGGKTASGKPTDANEIYEPNTDQWSSGIPLPMALSAYALTTYEGRIYLFGGWDGSKVVNSAFVFDIGDNSWSELPPMPTARSYAGAVVVGGKIFVIGGWDGVKGLTVNEAFIPDNPDVSTSWKFATDLPYSKYAMGITNLADIIFIIGGVGLKDTPAVIALAPGDQNWSQLPSPLNMDLSYLGVTTIGTKFFILGGKIGELSSTEMWSYQALFTVTLPIIR